MMTVSRLRRALKLSSTLLSIGFLLVGSLLLVTGEGHDTLRRKLSEAVGPETDEQYQKRLASHQKLFHQVDEIEVLGPTSFPKPTDHAKHRQRQDVFAYLKPYHGKHRSDVDVVTAFASEYQVNNYICFIESLRATGFDGDIVLTISPIDAQNEKVWNYLKTVPGLVVYVPNLVCYNFEGEATASAKGGMRTCQCNELYGHMVDGKAHALDDPRGPRTFATMRYEIYWIIMLNYSPHSWFLVVDARDTFFQSNPFEHVPRKTDPSAESGLLYFFGENVDATRLGKSKQNNKWLRSAYGHMVGDKMSDKPTICSGATMGEQVAMESYARAMVAESDDTGTVLMGADQGFHNFLYYSHKLKNDRQIHDIVVFDQGTGIVNNMGALRTKPLAQWGNGKIARQYKDGSVTRYQVLNWDGSVVPVVHQFDRHKELSAYFFKVRTNELAEAWKKRQR